MTVGVRWWWSSVALLLALGVALPGGLWRAPGAAAGGSLEKLSPWVVEHTADGRQAEFLVVLSRQANLREADRLNTKLEKGRFVRQALWGVAQETQGPVLSWLRKQGVEYRPFYIVNAIWVKADREVAVALGARADVARIDGNPAVRGMVPPADSATGAEWAGSPLAVSPQAVEPNLAYVHAPEVWALGFTGQGIVVGGQDTGYEWTHPALRPQYRGWDGVSVTHEYNWHDAIHVNAHGENACGVDSPLPCDDYGHGTHTMGIAVGSDGAANQIGMAPGARWIGCRNMDLGYGTPASYLECFEFFLAPYPVGGAPEQGNPDLAPDVTNNSWSCPPSEGCAVDTLQAAVEAQRAAGIFTVASAGNGGPACSTIGDPPGLYGATLTIGALNSGHDTVAGFSSRGPVTADGSGRLKPDMMAPGTEIRSSIPGGGYASVGWNGTSMASPHVAGGVALLWSAVPWLRGDITATVGVLEHSAAVIPTTECGSAGVPNNVYGYGRLNVQAAVQAAMRMRWYLPLVENNTSQR